jgi:hypothetical protein
MSNKRPSAAMIVAMIALVAAFAGTAIAADPAAKLSKSKVKKIADKRIAAAAPNLTVGSANTANTANTAKIASNLLSANVLASGATLGSIPAGVTSAKTAAGTYEVVFPRSIAGCTLSVSPGSATSPTPVLVGAAPKANAPNTVIVFTRSAANVVSDQDFYVQAVCPG